MQEAEKQTVLLAALTSVVKPRLRHRADPQNHITVTKIVAAQNHTGISVECSYL